MPENESAIMPEIKIEKPSSESKSPLSSIVAVVGMLSTLVTIFLTVYNAHTKSQIDAAESRLKERSEQIEESKERVARYAWVRTLFPDLEDSDQQKRTFTLSLIGLALNDTEAKKLFAGLSTSQDKNLQQAGQTGLANLKTEGISQLVAQLNADTPEERKTAVGLLSSKYASSPFAISAALDLLQESNARNLSPSGIIDVLYFLGLTDSTAWTKEQVLRGRQALVRIDATNPGPQTRTAMSNMKSVLDNTHIS